VSTSILVPLVFSQSDLELTSQGQFHVLVAASKYCKSFLQSVDYEVSEPSKKLRSGSRVQLTES
jgi:hypothetical protein